LSTLGENTIAAFQPGRKLAVTLAACNGFPLQKARLRDLQGGDAAANAEMIRNLVAGKDRGPRRDAVLINAAAALMVAGKAGSWEDGWGIAQDLLDTGRAAAKLEELVRKEAPSPR
jgi:anthranilate phosphoribosyltransferase